MTTVQIPEYEKKLSPKTVMSSVSKAMNEIPTHIKPRGTA